MKHILAVLFGVVFGIANIIPGVSGGTMLVVFGCYDKVCGALTLNLKEIKKNIVFLVFFGIGALCGLVGFSFVITYLFGNFPIPTNMFFIGLIIGSVPLILKNATVKEKARPTCIIPFLIALAAVIGLTLLNNSVSGEAYKVNAEISGGTATYTVENLSDKTIGNWNMTVETDGEILSGNGAEVSLKDSIIDKAKNFIKGGNGLNKYAVKGTGDGMEIAPNSSYTFTLDGKWNAEPTAELAITYKMSVLFFLWLILAGFIAAVAMIIPGVSGAFVLMTLGAYETAIGSIKSLDIITMLPIVIGVLVGLVVGARLITMLMKKFRLIVYSAIMGLVVGSIYAIMPTGAGLNVQTLVGAIALIVGGAVSLLVGSRTKVEE